MPSRESCVKPPCHAEFISASNYPFFAIYSETSPDRQIEQPHFLFYISIITQSKRPWVGGAYK